MNVQENRKEKINKINIYVTQNLGYGPFQIYGRQ